MEEVNAVLPIADLRWAIEHAYEVSGGQLTRLLAIGAGLTVSDSQYLRVVGAPSGPGGPPFRSIIDSGVHVAGGSDASNISPVNPWICLYYMVSGRNAAGDVVNAGEQITRMEALNLYTVEGAWWNHEDDSSGSLEIGKRGDLAVLKDHYLSVPEAEIRTLTSVLTLLGGDVVHASEEFESLLDD